MWLTVRENTQRKGEWIRQGDRGLGIGPESTLFCVCVSVFVCLYVFLTNNIAGHVRNLKFFMESV